MNIAVTTRIYKPGRTITGETTSCVIDPIRHFFSVGRDSIPVRRPDSQSREPGFKSHFGKFDHSCINEYE